MAPGRTRSRASDAPPSIDGFTPEQRFFLGWRQVWCENVRPERARLRAQTDPHSPGQYRVNGVVSNMPEFQKAFACKAGAPMVRKNRAASGDTAIGHWFIWLDLVNSLTDVER